MTKIFLATLLAFSATPALAEPITVTSTVQTADLDLSSADGQRQLDRRIARAAREVCGSASDADLEGKNEVRRCRAETIAAAASQRDHLLAAVRNGAPILVASAR